jgi:PTH1 family peptidyl-tRNA hydrolase
VLSIATTLGSPDFYRVKLGLGRPPAVLSPEEFVLRPFPREVWEDVAVLVTRGAQAVSALITQGLAAAQNQFHGAGVEAD